MGVETTTKLKVVCQEEDKKGENKEIWRESDLVRKLAFLFLKITSKYALGVSKLEKEHEKPQKLKTC